MEDVPFKYLACKYPIPLQYAELLWINNHFKTEFFHELSTINKGNPVQNGHPFVFNTSTGKILTPNEVYRKFKSTIKRLSILIEREWKVKRKNTNFDKKRQLNTEYENLIFQLNKVKGIHSLRHMYAIMWADLAATSKEVDIDDLQSLCAYGLGHKSLSSVMQYFTLRKKTRQKLLNKINQTTDDQITYIQKNLINLQRNKRGRYGR